jgi:6-phosphofructokinase 2
MIVTLTMNPALDITTSADQVHPTNKIRCRGARYDAGGGGINVARVVSVLGGSVSAVFPVGGPTGDLLTELVPYRLARVSPSTKRAAASNTGSSYLAHG